LQASQEGSIQVFTTTLDGSAGHTGFVTDLLTAEPSASELADIDFIYTCGPEPMMVAVEQFATSRRIPGEMSLETALACGVGACLGCARRLKTDPGASPVYAKVCKDGPVFSFGQVELNPVPCGEE
jgi:dihydroorotate dehydrogenase electron transfer subunit